MENRHFSMENEDILRVKKKKKKLGKYVANKPLKHIYRKLFGIKRMITEEGINFRKKIIMEW